MGYRRAMIERFGGPEVIEVVDEAVLPEPQTGEVRIRVEASSVTATDNVIRKGIYPLLKDKPPFTPGYDVVGIVDKLGAGVENLRVGQRVADLLQIGGNAEYICRPARTLLIVPDELDPAEAVCLVLSWMTAYQMLKQVAHVQPRQKILVQGGSGAVGTALLQLGWHLGLEVVATASVSKLDLLRSYGATAIDYRATDYEQQLKRAAGNGFEAAFDAIGLSSFRRSHKYLKRGGKLVTYGTFSIAGKIAKRTPLKFVLFGLNYMAMLVMLLWWNLWPNGKSAQFFGIVDSHDDYPERFAEDFNELLELLMDGAIKPVVAARLPLDKAAHAHEMLDSGRVCGQLVLVMT